MKRLLLSAVAVTSFAFVLPEPTLLAQEKPASEMGESMDKMSGAFRRVRRMVNAGDMGPEVQALLATIKTEAVAAAKHTPMMAAEIPEASRAKFVADFKTRMEEFIAAVGKTEAAVKAGDKAAAAALISDLAAMQKSGHTDFKKKDEKK